MMSAHETQIQWIQVIVTDVEEGNFLSIGFAELNTVEKLRIIFRTGTIPESRRDHPLCPVMF